MNAELRELLVCASIGLAVGMVVARTRPNWCKAWTKFCLNGQWKLFACAAVLFGAGVVLMAAEGRFLHAVVSLALCVLEIYALFRFGLRPLTVEEARKIDESDPAPLSFGPRGQRS